MDAAREDVLTDLDYPKEPLARLLTRAASPSDRPACWRPMGPDRLHQPLGKIE
jgi:hypothetical protein